MLNHYQNILIGRETVLEVEDIELNMCMKGIKILLACLNFQLLCMSLFCKLRYRVHFIILDEAKEYKGEKDKNVTWVI